jgi:PAS domain S-box-containing protein
MIAREGVDMVLMLVEDNPTDSMAIQARLRRGFPNAQILGAEDADHFNEHLGRPGCDVVITDYWLGWSDGLSVLQRVHERWPRARVIMLTGNGGEEVVAGAFKYGLYHYLVKPDGFDELVPVIGAAMKSKRREESYELMATIFNTIPEAVHCVDAAGNIAAINSAACQMYGYTDLDIVGRTNEILLPALRREEIRKHLLRAFSGETVPHFQTMQLHSEGIEVPVTMTIVPLRRSDSTVSAVACIAGWNDKAMREISQPGRRHEPQAPPLSLDLTRH